MRITLSIGLNPKVARIGIQLALELFFCATIDAIVCVIEEGTP